MPSPVKLIADSGSTKTTWYLLADTGSRQFQTDGISPYFLSSEEITTLLEQQLIPFIDGSAITEIHYYGTGLANPANEELLRKILSALFTEAQIEVNHDLMGAARALCGRTEGIACILGTGSNSCHYDGSRIVRNSPGLGYILGDEGSGAYLGKKIIQHYLYGSLDEELRAAFDEKYRTNTAAILERVYKQPLANRYLASFTHFLSEHRGHFMIENIIEDGLNDFFFTHVRSYDGYHDLPLHFTGSIAFVFRDVLTELMSRYECVPGQILNGPIEGLVSYHAGVLPANKLN